VARAGRIFAISVGVWTLLGALGSAQVRVASAIAGAPASWREAVATTFSDAAAWALLTPAVVALALAAPLARGRLARSLAALAAGAVATWAAHTALHLAVDAVAPWSDVSGGELAAHARELAAHHLLIAPGIFVAIVALVQLGRARREARARELAAARLAAELSDARLRALTAQLRPHFLFNTLNAISALVTLDPEGAQRTLARLGDLLRATLDAGDAAEVPLARELEILEAYLAIERQRHGARLRVEVECPPALGDLRVPALLLQPLVENAVCHGIAPRPGPGAVRVTAALTGGRLELVVEDDGVGAGDATLGDGVGLGATRARLREMYGAAAELELAARAAGGTRVRCAIPARRGPPGVAT
jgi:hypothetical protein